MVEAKKIKGKKCPSCGQVNVEFAYRCNKCEAILENVDTQEYNPEEFVISINEESFPVPDSQEHLMSAIRDK